MERKRDQDGAREVTPAGVALDDTVDSAEFADDEARAAFEATRTASAMDPVSETARSAPPVEALAAGTAVGRYVVETLVGSGGMGVVYAARDTELDRRVALKFLRGGDDGDREREERLRREAKAMARLSHPHVATVFDVGRHDGRLFIAMELIEGPTLRDWLGETRRSREQILGLFLDAGRGLAAAHEAGIVHRDFKPENVLLTRDGAVRVADFGLVGIRAHDDPPATEDSEELLDETLTLTGSLLGTPAYMAPEQHERTEDVGPLADQFAFCVSLWEALYGERPFEGKTYWKLARSVIAGKIREPPADRAVPRWLHDVVRRGLRTEPADRWPSMDALLEALARDPDAERRRRRARLALGAGGTVLAGAAAFGLWLGLTAGESKCQGMDERLDGVWDEPRRAAVRDAFLASERPYAEDTYRRVTRELDDYTGAWVATRVEACEATHVTGEQSEALLDLRMGCLDRTLLATHALVDVFADDPDAEVVDRAVEAVAGLPPLGACDDVDALRAAVPLPDDPGARDEVDAVRARLAEVRALHETGSYDDALAAARAAVEQARPLGYAPALAEALTWRGRLEGESGDAAAAEKTYEEALVAAADARDDALAARIWSHRLNLVGSDLGRPAEAVRMQPAAEAALRRAGSGAEEKAHLAGSLGIVFHADGQYDEARRHHERAVAILEELHGPDDPRLAGALNALGLVLRKQNELDEADRHFERAQSIWERALGSDHPRVAHALTNRAAISRRRADYARARTQLERALAIWEEALGPEHPKVAYPLNTLGNVVYELGEYDEARRLYERALTINEEALGPKHPEVAGVLTSVGNVHYELGEHEQAREHYERALAIFEEALGPDHPHVAFSLSTLGNAYLELGRHDEARAHHERSLAIWEKALGPEHPNVGLALNSLGNVLHDQGEHDEALGYYERALAVDENALGRDNPAVAYDLVGLAGSSLALGRTERAREAAARALQIWEGAGAAPAELAGARFLLARALWARPAEHSRALELARAARDGFEAAGAAGAKGRAEVAAWLAERAAP